MGPTSSPPPSAGDTSGDCLAAERDALRVQAAAVVAQQAALLEKELRLNQQQTNLQRQEQQLAAHLEEKQRQLRELREQVKTEREAWKVERSAEEAKFSACRQETEQAYSEADADRKLVQKERARFVELRKRLKHRWSDHFTAREAELASSTADIETQKAALESKAQELERRRTEWAEEQRRQQGEMELGRRQLDKAWEELGLAQQEWDVALNQERVDSESRGEQLAKREVAVACWEQELARKQSEWDLLESQRQREAEGLETRVRNLRTKLQAQEEALIRLEAGNAARNGNMPAAPAFSLTAPNLPAAPEARPEAPVALNRLVGCLADQRLHLLEQWRSVLELQDHWHQERDGLIADFEAASRYLMERDREIGEREQSLANQAKHLEQRQHALVQMRGVLEGRQLRQQASSLDWEADKARLLAETRSIQDEARHRGQHVRKAARRTIRRHRSEIQALAATRQRFEEARRQYVASWEECREKVEALMREQKALSSEALALERLRLELIGNAENAAVGGETLGKTAPPEPTSRQPGSSRS